MKKKVYVFLFLALGGLFLLLNSKKINSRNNINFQTKTDSISFKTFKQGKFWGYDIYLNEKLYIHQPNIPAIPGNDGFLTEDYAKKTAELVKYKIKNNVIPPTISKYELDSLGVK
jgi:hypothetical protein